MHRLNKGILAGMVTLMAVSLVGCGSEKKEEYKYVDLQEYYGIEANEYGIIINGEGKGCAIEKDGEIYLPQDIVAQNIDSRFYLDKENEQIRYAKATSIDIKDVGETGDVIKVKGEVYLALKYVEENAWMDMHIAESPNRIIIYTEAQSVDGYATTEKVRMRRDESTNAEVMLDLKKGEIVYEPIKEVEFIDTTNVSSGVNPRAEENNSNDGTTSVSDSEDIADKSLPDKDKDKNKKDALSDDNAWILVETADGVRGYVMAKYLKPGETKTYTSDFKDVEYTHIEMDEAVCLGWNQLENVESNANILDKIMDRDAMNVISPTWYKVTGHDGSITSKADKAYVDTAHAYGLKVWALVDDFTKDENGVNYIDAALSTTDNRTNLINALMNESDKLGFDGINIDFEYIKTENGYDYLQFMRELSVKCRNTGLVLSVDVKVPKNFSRQYHRKELGEILDYVIIMGYDEHWGGGEEAGSVASINFVKDGIDNTLMLVEPDRVINAIPFYTRMWIETPENISDGTGVYKEDSTLGNYYLTSRAYGMDAAKTLAKTYGANIYWLDLIGQNYAEYTVDNITYRVWLEDEKSLALKLAYMQEKNLAGVACWQLGFENTASWIELGKYCQNWQ